jgi:hypothetical protein
MNTVKDAERIVNVTEAEVRRAIAAVLPNLVRTVIERVVSERVARAIRFVQGRVD